MEPVPDGSTMTWRPMAGATRPTATSTPDSPAFVLGDRDLAAPLHAAGAPVTLVCRPTDIARYSRYVSGWLADPRPGDDALAAALLEAARAAQQPAVPFYEQDDDLLFVSRHRRELAAPRVAARAGVAWRNVKLGLLAAREEGISVRSWLRWAVACRTRTGLDPADPMPQLVGKLAAPLGRRIRRRVQGLQRA